MARRKAAATATRVRSRPTASPAPASAIGRANANQATSQAASGADTDEPEALVITRWFDAGDDGEPYSATVRFTGHRAGVQGKPTQRDTFMKEEKIDRIMPGSGAVSITALVYGLQPGEWSVNAELIRPSAPPSANGRTARARSSDISAAPPAVWSWRHWRLSDASSSLVKTRWALLAPLARQPAVMPGVYMALVALAALVLIALQATILANQTIPVGRALSVSAIAAASGLIGAKVWYAFLHPDESMIRGGWAVDGFFVVAPVVAALTLFAFDLPIGVYLDATTPGLFLGVAIGRVGCFFTGCCAGICTNSRWGVWSSDRRIGARRVPTQLLESAAGLIIGVVTLPLALAYPPVHGAIFIVAFGAYAVVRQLLLRLRAERRKSSRTVSATAVAAALALVVIVALSLAQGS